MLDKKYIFKSERLGFRNWIDSDLEKMARINSDKEVMEFFPKTYSEKETQIFIERMQNLYTKKGFCYFAVDKLIDAQFIGFIGLSEQTFKSDFTPCIDIGWRIDKNEWNNGFATEGALQCLHFAKEILQLSNISSIASVINVKSEHIMKKIGMKKIKFFEHPVLADNERLKACVLYQKELTSAQTIS